MVIGEKPPAGRRETRKAERRASIVAIASRKFMEFGFERTSMSAIAEEMGGSKGTLWSYFACKEELFAAVLEESTKGFRAAIATILSPEFEVGAAIRRFTERFIDRVTADDSIAAQRTILGEVSRSPELGRIYFEQAPGVAHASLSDYIARQMAAGALRTGDPDEAARVLLSLCTGGYTQRVLWGVDCRTSEDANRQAAIAAEHFLRDYGIEDQR